MPVRDEKYRRAKYEAKVDPDVVKARIAALKESMVEQTTSKFVDLVQMENSVKSYLESLTGADAVKVIEIPFYLNCARELWKAKQKFTGETLKAKADIIINKWAANGLKKTTLQGIADLLGVPYTTTSTSS